MNRLLKFSFIFVFAAISAVSCNKDEDSPLLEQNSTLAVVPINTVVTGDFITPNSAVPPTGNWGDQGYDLLNNDITSPFQVTFKGRFDGDITTDGSTYYLGYADLDTVTTTLSSVTAAQISPKYTPASGNLLGYNGWYQYNLTTHAVTKIPGRYVVVSDQAVFSAATKLYVLQIETIDTYEDPTGSGSYRGHVYFKYKKLK